ncbi:hypothetical protein BJV77DRAFT_1070271 [Russula vinacea]|nr:hypothetical protein BJV77DRAFT_1070271 [Russula vinacea]
MAARHFLCCLPLRLGALLISLFYLLVAGLLAVGDWFILESMRGHLPNFLRGIIASDALFSSFLSITALFGVFGTLARKASLLRAYAYFLTYSIVVKIIVNVAYVWAFFSQSRQSLVDRCIAGSTDQDVKDICDAEFDTGKWPSSQT